MARNNAKHQLLPHAYWIIGILIAFNIIFLAIIFTCKIYNANSLISFISNASTLLSIALSVFAILYTFSSNIQIQQQFEKINNAANIIVSGITHTLRDSKQSKGIGISKEELINFPRQRKTMELYFDQSDNSFLYVDNDAKYILRTNYEIKTKRGKKNVVNSLLQQG